MGNFFNRRHPLIMQALGGLIAVIVMIPVGIYVFQSVFNSPAPETAAPSYAPPPAATAAASSSSTGAGATGAPTGATTGKTYTVKMQPVPGKPGQYEFNPATLDINRGDTVNWVDADTTPHNIVGTSSNATSVIKKTAIDASSYKVTFTATGSYKYECQVHLPEMIGVINVSNKTSPSSGSSGHGTAAGTTTQGLTIKMQPVPGKAGQYEFNPATVSIKAGTVVNWVDADTTPHNIVGTSNNALNLIHKTAIDATSYSVAFKTPGTYKYECQVHLPEMVGQITVT